MPDDDAKARKARAKRLEEEINKLEKKSPIPPDPAQEAEEQIAHPEESPRDFIQRRMRELDEAEKAKRKPKPKG
jgi:hypothetical protein